MQTERKPKETIRKGASGYIDAQKKKRVFRTLLYCAIGVAVFFLGLCLNKFEKNNIFTVIAILFVLPAAKALVGFIVLAPFRSVELSRVNEVKKHIGEHDVMYTDMVFTSPDKIMFLAFLVIKNGELLCLAGRAKEDTAYIEQYFKTELKKRMLSGKIYITADEKKFLEHLSHTAASTEPVSEEMTDYFCSLMV